MFEVSSCHAPLAAGCAISQVGLLQEAHYSDYIVKADMESNNIRYSWFQFFKNNFSHNFHRRLDSGKMFKLKGCLVNEHFNPRDNLEAAGF